MKTQNIPWHKGPASAGADAPRTWHKGPPPHIGWWNASFGEPKQMRRWWRWWNGACWSSFALDTDNAQYAAAVAGLFSGASCSIAWTDYYPEGARVPRVDPTKRENAGIVAMINTSRTSKHPGYWEGEAWGWVKARAARGQV